MAKYCTNCGKELNANAAMCLNCGVLVGNNTTNTNTNANNVNQEKKKGLPTWAIVLIIIGAILLIPIIILIIIGVTAYNAIDSAIDDVNDSINDAYNDYYSEEKIETGTIGDTLSSKDFKITLNKALMYDSVKGEYYDDEPDLGKEYLVFFLEVENISSESKSITKYEFTGYVDGYEVSPTFLLNDINDVENLSATLLPGKKAKGYVAFEIDTTWKEFDIEYSDWFSNKKIVFTVVNQDDNSSI